LISHDLTINHSDLCRAREVIDDIEATVVLVNLKHPTEIKTEGMAKNDTVYRAMTNQEDIISLLILQNIFKTM
jgi:hypothetical protein